jgi:hypothetical protein
MISVEDYLFFVDDALDGMIAIVEELGDEKANLRPELEGSNTPYVILTHCLGVMEYWGGHAVARWARAQLVNDLAEVAPFDPPRLATTTDSEHSPKHQTQGGALIHLYEELAQHRGQMEGCRDILRAPWATLVTQE